MAKERIKISFSGGRTSAKMSKWIKDNYGETHDLLFVFANTGQEHEETLWFIDRCDKEWGLNVVWVEPVVHFIYGKGITHRIVTYETATRDGRLFDDVCRKYGIPNMGNPHCTKHLKLYPMNSYLREIGWQKAKTAIGIRADEADRISPKFKELNYWFPMIELGETKETVNNWWEKQDWNLSIPERLGNCTWCWKKSFAKHQENIKDSPSIYEVPNQLEEKYEMVKTKNGIPRNFFRKHMSTKDLINAATEQLDMFANFDVNQSYGCEESCEAMGTDKSPDNFEMEEY